MRIALPPLEEDRRDRFERRCRAMAAEPFSRALEALDDEAPRSWRDFGRVAGGQHPSLSALAEAPLWDAFWDRIGRDDPGLARKAFDCLAQGALDPSTPGRLLPHCAVALARLGSRASWALTPGHARALAAALGRCAGPGGLIAPGGHWPSPIDARLCAACCERMALASSMPGYRAWSEAFASAALPGLGSSAELASAVDSTALAALPHAPPRERAEGRL